MLSYTDWSIRKQPNTTAIPEQQNEEPTEGVEDAVDTTEEDESDDDEEPTVFINPALRKATGKQASRMRLI